MPEAHDARVGRLRDAYRESHARFVQRLHSVPEDVAARAPSAGGWSVAQIGWHVAAVDGLFASLVSGERPVPPLPDTFVERPWADILASLPERIESASAVVPPGEVAFAGVMEGLERSAEELDAALAALTPERGARCGVTHPVFGTVNLYQIGDWAIAHTIRHNAQAKRVLNSLSPSPSAGV